MTWLQEARELAFNSTPKVQSGGFWNYWGAIDNSLDNLLEMGITPDNDIIKLRNDHGNMTTINTGTGKQMYFFKPRGGLEARVVNPWRVEGGMEPMPIAIGRGNYLFDMRDQGTVLNTVSRSCPNSACSLSAIWAAAHEGNKGFERIAEDVARYYAREGEVSSSWGTNIQRMKHNAPVWAIEPYLRDQGFWTYAGDEADRRRSPQTLARVLGDGVISYGMDNTWDRGYKHSVGVRDGRVVDVMLGGNANPRNIFFVAGRDRGRMEQVQEFLSKRL